VILFWFGIMTGSDQITLKKLTGALAADISGLGTLSTERVFSTEDLFEYINGNAELFISYNFNRLITLTYNQDESAEITIDIFDMGAPANAFGVFSHSREKVDGFISDEVESEYGGGLLTFWKGQYYISILAYPETGEKKETVRQIAKRISEMITGESTKPAIVSLLPPEGLAPSSVRYFYHHIWLNSHYFVSGENILNMGEDTEAVLAKYDLPGENKTSAVLLIVGYPDIQRSESAYRAFMKNFLPEGENGFARLADHRWAGCERKGKIITIVLNAPEKAVAERVLNRVRYK